MTPSIACFVSSHGFGHAARACAVMAAIQRRDPRVCFEIFSQTPRWFFEESLTGRFNLHETQSDIGLVQASPMQQDIPATLQKLADFLPFDPAHLARLAHTLQRLDCRLALCDISPLGLAAARAAGIPSILVENFTWDWIYTPYLDEFPALQPFISQLAGLFQSADYHIQTEPVCLPSPRASLLTAPVYREALTPARDTRQRLGIPPDSRMVLVTMGGIPEKFPFLDALSHLAGTYLVIPGASRKLQQRGSLILLPHHSEFYHPDLLTASDAVIGKAGYSTIAETYHAGIPFAYIARPNFRESPPLVEFVRREIPSFEIPEPDFARGNWISRLDELLSLPRMPRPAPNGADQVAEFVMAL